MAMLLLLIVCLIPAPGLRPGHGMDRADCAEMRDVLSRDVDPRSMGFIHQ